MIAHSFSAICPTRISTTDTNSTTFITTKNYSLLPREPYHSRGPVRRNAPPALATHLHDLGVDNRGTRGRQKDVGGKTWRQKRGYRRNPALDAQRQQLEDRHALLVTSPREYRRHERGGSVGLQRRGLRHLAQWRNACEIVAEEPGVLGDLVAIPAGRYVVEGGTCRGVGHEDAGDEVAEGVGEPSGWNRGEKATAGRCS